MKKLQLFVCRSVLLTQHWNLVDKDEQISYVCRCRNISAVYALFVAGGINIDFNAVVFLEVSHGRRIFLIKSHSQFFRQGSVSFGIVSMKSMLSSAVVLFVMKNHPAVMTRCLCCLLQVQQAIHVLPHTHINMPLDIIQLQSTGIM